MWAGKQYMMFWGGKGDRHNAMRENGKQTDLEY